MPYILLLEVLQNKLCLETTPLYFGVIMLWDKYC